MENQMSEDKKRLNKDQLLVITSPMVELFRNKGEKNIGDLIALYIFYVYTAKWQKTNQIKCTTGYVANGLNWSENKVRKIKKLLIDMELIEDKKTKKSTGRGKETVISGWYIHLKYLLKEETLLKVLSHPYGFPEGGTPQTVGNQGTNALNTININALNTINKYTSKEVYRNATHSNESSSKKETIIIDPMSQENLTPHVHRLLQRMLDSGLFVQKMREPGERGYKTLLSCQKFLLSLGTTEFMKLYKFDSVWMKKNKINPEILSQMNDSGTLFDELGFDLDSLVNIAIERYQYMWNPMYHPPSKGYLTNKLDKFLYNYGCKSSYFLCCIFNPPKMLKSVQKNYSPVNLNGLGLTDRDRLFLEKWGKGWEAVSFKQKVMDLKHWWDSTRRDLDIYHQMGDNHGGWRSDFYSFSKILKRLREFQDDWGVEWKLGNFGIGNKTWDNFLSWVREKYSVDLNPGKDKIKRALEYRNQEDTSSFKIDYKESKEEQEQLDAAFAEKLFGKKEE